MSQENVEVVRRAYEAFNQGDLEGMVANVAPDSEYVASGAIPGAGGVYRGPEGLKEFISWLREAFEDARVEVEVHDLNGADNHVLVAVTNRGRGKQSGIEASWTVWQLWTLRDGRMVRGQGFTSRKDALGAAGLSE